MSEETKVEGTEENEMAARLLDLELDKYPWYTLVSATTRKKLAELGVSTARELPEKGPSSFTPMQRTEVRCAHATMHFIEQQNGHVVLPETSAVQTDAEHAKTLNIHQRLHASMMDKAYVQKMGRMASGAGGYSYVRHDDVIREVRSVLLRHRVIMTVNTIDHKLEMVQGMTRPAERRAPFTQIEVSVAFVNIDNPEDTVVVNGVGYGIDTQDKGAGKAFSYAVKYALLKTMMLETGEDEEERLPEPLEVNPTAGAPRPVPAFEAAPSPSDEFRMTAAPTEAAFSTAHDREQVIDAYVRWSGLTKDQLGGPIRHAFDVIGCDPMIDPESGKDTYDQRAWVFLGEAVQGWMSEGVTWDTVQAAPPAKT